MSGVVCRRRLPAGGSAYYKDLEKGKWVTIVNWVGPQQDERMITAGIHRAADKGDAVASRLVAGRSLKRDRSKRGA